MVGRNTRKLNLISSEGGPFERGLQHGRLASDAIGQNIANFWNAASALLPPRDRAFNYFQNTSFVREIFDDDSLEYMKGVARGSNALLADIIALNSLRQFVSPDECSVLIAMGDWTTTRSPIVLKNSDKIGSDKFKGNGFHGFKEINVALLEKPDNGHKFAGIAAAGEIGIKMGMNELGVATGANISRTLDLKQKNLDVSKVRALDRNSLQRKGVSCASTSREAAKLVAAELLNQPMSTPGNLEFVDAENAFLIEGSYDRISVMQMGEGFVVRVNRFEVLNDLNDPENVSSYARYVRANELLSTNKGTVNVEKMTEFSKDHANGPGINSICRHDYDYHSETSLSAAVMEINSSDPKSSKFHFCLGKPCVAWSEPDCHFVIDMTAEPQDIPEKMRSGESWKEHYTEEPAIN